MMRKGKVFYKNILAGFVYQDDDGYGFSYDEDYLRSENPEPVSLTLPLTEEPYRAKTMLPFFDGLIPEGWLLTIAEKNWKLNANDRMGLLLAVCKDCIGAVHIEPIIE
ncbi:MAG: HipA N-terminal domain-containing protein [Ignavibacteriae bacterium]|nr:HipA N-terminal domain-containing protein [Ignavibacteriota bacterium]